MRIEGEIIEAGFEAPRLWLTIKAAGRRVYAEFDTRDSAAMRRLATIIAILPGRAYSNLTESLVGLIVEADVVEAGKGATAVMVAIALHACPHRNRKPARLSAA